MKQRDTLGRYTKVYRKASRWEVLFVYSVLGGMLFGIVFDIINKPHIFEAQQVAEAYVEEVIVEPVEVMIEIKYDWTQERIEQEIRTVFKEEPEKAVRVAMCEGIVNGKLNPTVVNPTNGSNDTGIFQISMKYHGAEVARQGLDMTNVIDNINYAYQLYKKNGWNDWIWSKPCWNK